jgi:hypothetical protein
MEHIDDDAFVQIESDVFSFEYMAFRVRTTRGVIHVLATHGVTD